METAADLVLAVLKLLSLVLMEMVLLSSGNVWAALTAIATAGILVVGVWAIQAKRQDDRRADRLNRVNRQLSQLYGKLLMLHEAGAKSWHSFIRHHGNDAKELDAQFIRFFPFDEKEEEPSTKFNPPPPNAVQLKAYREWLEMFFIPTNEQLLHLMSDNADLVVGEKMQEAFVTFAKHVVSLKLLLLKVKQEEKEEWSDFLNDWKQYVRLMGEYPSGIDHHIRASFNVLREEQERLLCTHATPLTEAALATEIERRHWILNDYWTKREHEDRQRIGQIYEYMPEPVFGIAPEQPPLTWWRKLMQPRLVAR